MPLQLREITSMEEAREFHGRRALIQRIGSKTTTGYIALGKMRSDNQESHVYLDKDHGSSDVLWYSDGRKANDAIGYVIEGFE